MDTTHLARLLPLLPEIIVGGGAMALLMAAVFSGGRPGRAVDYAAIAVLAIAGVALFFCCRPAS